MIRMILLLVCLPGLVFAGDLMEGKVKTSRTVELEVTVDAAPMEVYSLWTTREGVRKFFAPDAEIGAAPGEPYTILFAPGADPQGLSHGTKGAHLLKMVPGKVLSFEWITFAADTTLKENAPPYASPDVRNARPLPTWVELTFEPVRGTADRTHVKFAHYGFRDGDLWGKSFEWFSRAWDQVLKQLAEYCKTRNPAL